MRKIYNILITLMLSLSLLNSCTEVKKPTNYGVQITSVKHLGIDTLNLLQLDSIIKSDTLPDFNNWLKTYIKDAETNKAYQYRVLYNRDNGIIYTTKQLNDSIYILQKKETKKK